MTEIKQRLFDAFRDDHAVLGRGLYTLGTCLREGDAEGVRKAASDIDIKAGAHIAFEQSDFYPALKPFLSIAEIDAMYVDHFEGQGLLTEIQLLQKSDLDDDNLQQKLIEAVEQMETHASECGELFGVMGGLNEAAQEHLLQRIDYWRERAPRWTSLPMEH